nr:monocarboxylate transporter 7-like [Lytechinus pictus]
MPGGSNCERCESGSNLRLRRKRWVILFGLFFVSFLENGIIRSIALILDDLTQEFDITAAHLGTLLGLVFGAPHYLGWLNIPLLRRFSVRQLVMFGGTVSTLGLVASSWAQTASQFSAAMSAYGIGNILILVPTNTCPKDYFPKLVMIATGILLSGGSMGVTVMPWFFRELLVEYGWRGSLLILGGLNAHLVVVASLQEPMKRMDSSQDSDKKSPSSSRAGENENELSSSDDLSRSHKDLHTVTNTAASEPSKGQLSFNDDDGGQTDGQTVKTRSIISKGFKTTTRFIGLTIFKDHPLMALLCLQAFVFGLSYIGWLLYIVPNALAKGHSSQKAVQISIVGGAFNFIGRLGIGFFWSRKYIKFKLWYSLICLLSAALFWINFVAQRFEILMVLSAFYGVFMGALVTSQFQLVMNVVGEDSPEDYKTGMSIFFIGRGLSSPIAGAIFGKFLNPRRRDVMPSQFKWKSRLYDITKSYDISFVFISGLNVLNAFLCIAPLCWSRWRQRKRLRTDVIE